MQTKIENIVSSATVGTGFDLKTVSEKLPGSDYDPNAFPGVLWKQETGGIAFLILGNGKVILTGAKSFEEIRTATSELVQKLTASGIDIGTDVKIHIREVVASAEFGIGLDLNAVALALGVEKTEYAPNEFPGLIYRMGDPNVTILLFNSGKAICTGSKKVEEVDKAFQTITEEMKAKGLLP